MTILRSAPLAAVILSLAVSAASQAQNAVNVNVPEDTQKSDDIVLPAPTQNSVELQPSYMSEEPVETEPDIRGLVVSRHEGVMNSLMTATVSRVHVKVGQRVKKGAKLVSFDCSALNARHASALARLKQQELLRDANRELAAESAITELDLLMSEAKVEEGHADVQNVVAQLARCVTRAPYNGVITDIVAEAKESVQNGDPLVAIVDDMNLDMIVHVPSAWIKDKLVGKRFKVLIDETGQSYNAKIKRITPKIDASSGTVEVTATVEGSHSELLPGMSGAAEFPDSP